MRPIRSGDEGCRLRGHPVGTALADVFKNDSCPLGEASPGMMPQGGASSGGAAKSFRVLKPLRLKKNQGKNEDDEM
jgi:hypothetical protein